MNATDTAANPGSSPNLNDLTWSIFTKRIKLDTQKQLEFIGVCALLDKFDWAELSSLDITKDQKSLYEILITSPFVRQHPQGGYILNDVIKQVAIVTLRLKNKHRFSEMARTIADYCRKIIGGADEELEIKQRNAINTTVRRLIICSYLSSPEQGMVELIPLLERVTQTYDIGSAQWLLQALTNARQLSEDDALVQAIEKNWIVKLAALKQDKVTLDSAIGESTDDIEKEPSNQKSRLLQLILLATKSLALENVGLLDEAWQWFRLLIRSEANLAEYSSDELSNLIIDTCVSTARYSRIRASLDLGLNLPDPPDLDFVGRKSELHFLRDWFSAVREPAMFITGVGGVGKTALTMRFCEDLLAKNEVDLVLWKSYKSKVLVDSDEFGRLKPTSKQTQDAVDFPLPVMGESKEAVEPNPTYALTKKIGDALNLLHTTHITHGDLHSTNLLVVLDDFNEFDEEAQELLRESVKGISKNVRFIVTSRFETNAIRGRRLTCSTLNISDTTRLWENLRERYPSSQNETKDFAIQIAKQGNPFEMRWLAYHWNELGSPEKVAELSKIKKSLASSETDHKHLDVLPAPKKHLNEPKQKRSNRSKQQRRRATIKKRK